MLGTTMSDSIKRVKRTALLSLLMEFTVHLEDHILHK